MWSLIPNEWKKTLLLWKRLLCFWVKLQARWPIDQRRQASGPQSWLPILTTWFSLQNSKTLALTWIHEFTIGRKMLWTLQQVIPMHAREAIVCPGTCQWLSLASLFSSFSKNWIKLPRYILHKRHINLIGFALSVQETFLLLLRREYTIKGSEPTLLAFRGTSNSMTCCFLLVCMLLTTLHVWPSMSKSFTTEISGWPFSFFIHPEEETNWYWVDLQSSLILLQDRSKALP